MAPLVASGPARRAFEWLGRQDAANLIVEAADTPMHMGVLTVFEPGPSGADPSERLARLRAEVEGRLPAVPELLQVLRRSGLPAAGYIWVDDQAFRIEHHVKAARVAPPGDEAELLKTAARLMERLLDRSTPLWELWLLEGLSGGRWACLLKIHHAVTDGNGVLLVANTFFDTSPVAVRPAVPERAPVPPPPRRVVGLAAGTGVARGLWRAAMQRTPDLAGGAVAAISTFASVTARTWRGRRAQLRRPIGSRRRLDLVRLDLASVKRVAHAHGVKVNDVLLELAAAGLAGALEARGADWEGVVLRVLMAVNRPPDPASRRNRAAAALISVPLDSRPTADRLRAIAAESRGARRWQSAGVMEGVVQLAAGSRLGRFLSRHQGVVDLAMSNLVGPPSPLYLLGSRMLEAIPMTPISGNVTIDFCAVSYAGALVVGILADADAWPDLPEVAAGMRRGWRNLERAVPTEAAA